MKYNFTLRSGLCYPLTGFKLPTFQPVEPKLKDSCATLTLVSRRCTQRLGSRYNAPNMLSSYNNNNMFAIVHCKMATS